MRALPPRGCGRGVRGRARPRAESKRASRAEDAWEGARHRVRAPYAKGGPSASAAPSTAGHVKPGGKQGGPPSKAKYYPATDSGQVPRGKGEKHPGRGVKQRLKPRAHKQPEPSGDGVPIEE